MTDLRTFRVSDMSDMSEVIRDMEHAYALIQRTYNEMGTGFGRMTYETLMDCLEGLDVARANLSEAGETVLEEAVRQAKEADA